MKFRIFFFYMPFVYSELHSFITTYTGITGQTTKGIPEFSAVTTLDYQQIDYYDNDKKKIITKHNWMKDYASSDMWIEDTEIRKHVQQIYKLNIHVLMQRFNQSHGVHTYQRMYGCVWDDEFEETHGFDQYSYDGEDFISLDLKELRYIAYVPQAVPTVRKWNNDRTQLTSLKQYYDYECVYWLKEFLALRKVDLEKRAPQVFLLQKDSSSPVVCHATGFYPSGVTVTWLKNGLNHHEDVDLEELLPNEDETFQKTSYLHVPPDEWKNNHYVCEVRHMGKNILKTLTEDEIKSNNRPIPYFTIVVCVIIGVCIVLVICAAVYIVIKKQTSEFKPVSSGSQEHLSIDKGE